MGGQRHAAPDTDLRGRMMTPLEGRLDTHEAVCELRYDSINARLKRIEQILIGSCAAIIGMLLTLVLKL